MYAVVWEKGMGLTFLPDADNLLLCCPPQVLLELQNQERGQGSRAQQ